MQTYLLIDVVRGGEIVDTKDDPSQLNFDLVYSCQQWQVAFRTESEPYAGGPLTVIANVDYMDRDPGDHSWIAHMVHDELAGALAGGELDPYLSDGPLVDISDE